MTDFRSLAHRQLQWRLLLGWDFQTGGRGGGLSPGSRSNWSGATGVVTRSSCTSAKRIPETIDPGDLIGSVGPYLADMTINPQDVANGLAFVPRIDAGVSPAVAVGIAWVAWITSGKIRRSPCIAGQDGVVRVGNL